MARRRRSIYFALMGNISVVVVIISVLFTLILVYYRTHDLIRSVDVKLLTVAELTREIIGSDYHDRIVDKNSVTEEQFHNMVARNDDLCRRLNLQYLWSVLQVNGRLVFTSATHSDLNNAKSSCATFFETHQDPEAFAPAMRPELKPAYASFKNEWGKGRMILIPRKDAGGRRYIFGASVQLPELNILIHRTILTSIGIGLGVLVVTLLLALGLARSLAVPIVHLTKMAGCMVEGDLDQSPTPTNIQELQSLSDSLDQMRRDMNRKLSALQENEAFLSNLLNAIPIPVFFKNCEGQYLGFNRAFETFIGKTKDRMIGKTVFEINPPELAVKYHARDDELFENGNIQQYETQVKNADGILRDVLINKAVFTDITGTVQGLIGTFQDITERKRAEEELRASEERYRSLFENMVEGYAYCRMIFEDGKPQDWLYLAVNDAFTALTGLKEVTGKRVSEVIPGIRETDPVLFDIYARVALSGKPEKFELYVKALEQWFSVSVYSPEKEYFVAVFDVITERKQTEEEIKAAKAFLDRVIDMSPFAMWISDREGTIIRVNRSLCETIKLPANEIVGKYNVFQDVNLENQGIMPAVRAVFQKCEPARFSIPWKAAEVDGVDFTGARDMYIDVSMFPISNPQGELSNVVCQWIDITERKQAETALRESEARLRLALEAAKAGIWEWDLKTNQNIWSDELWRLYDLDPHTCNASFDGWRQSIVPDEREQVVASVKSAVARQSDILIEWRVNTSEKSPRWLMSRGQPLLDTQGKVTKYHGVVIDITARKQEEAARENLQEQLLQAQKLESVGRLAGGVAHDFNNMLGVIIGHTELALEQVNPLQPLHADLQEIQKAALRSADLTRQLLAFARKQTITPKVLDLNETVTGMLKMLQRLIGENIQLLWQPADNLWPIKIDPTQIDQILANLCVNARDAIADVGKIIIETNNQFFDAEYCATHADFTPGEYVRLTVTDTGCGMNKETLAKIFDPFFTTKEMGKGTGLGLATVYGIVRQNDGFINVYSEPGQGTTFSIYLPRHIGKTELKPIKTAEDALKPGKETILLVEDEPTILELTTKMLQMQGYTVLAAKTPGEAVRLAQEHAGEIHLLLTDVIMPEMNGRELAKNLLSLYPNLKRLFMSGYTADVIAHQDVLDEGVQFIQKPFSLKELSAKVREALDRI